MKSGMSQKMANDAHAHALGMGILSGLPMNCFYNGAEWANEQNAAAINELFEALTEAKLQIEYMESKAGVQYGTTAAILSRTEMILEKYAPK